MKNSPSINCQISNSCHILGVHGPIPNLYIPSTQLCFFTFQSIMTRRPVRLSVAIIRPYTHANYSKLSSNSMPKHDQNSIKKCLLPTKQLKTRFPVVAKFKQLKQFVAKSPVKITPKSCRPSRPTTRQWQSLAHRARRRPFRRRCLCALVADQTCTS